ncbi:cilia- and flagella-associated protein 251-like [Prorops nasuta]|uniref:cilia- and flagella-associated protein 251-like n=1 Tax=Prorops nasuta TaxID=863751 RepID=UPI0034CE5669
MQKVRREMDERKISSREGSQEARGVKGVEKLKFGKLSGWGGGMGRMRSGSVGSVEELMKGKRKEREEEGGEKEEESWVFSKTAKVMRTPEKREEDTMERIMKALEGIKVRMDGWEEGKREIIEKVKEEIEKDRKEWKEEIKSLEGRMEEMERREGDREKEREKEGKEKQRDEGEGEKGGIER